MKTKDLRRKSDRLLGLRVATFILMGALFSSGQGVVDSTSDGSDGALDLTNPGVIDFDPAALGLDPDGDHIFHFTTVNVGPGVTVKLSARFLNGPVVWLASGDVRIDGSLDLNGESGTVPAATVNLFAVPAVPGAGGFPGGVLFGAGGGPGGGGTSTRGFFTGNLFLVPLVGGSGGGGAGPSVAGGGAGGGAILIASSTSITVNGTILAQGGFGGRGGGSGGAIRLVAPIVAGGGALFITGGTSAGGTSKYGTSGRVRIEAFQRSCCRVFPPVVAEAAPFSLNLPTGGPPPMLKVTSVTDINGTQFVTDPPTASFALPDVTISDGSPVEVAVEASNIPVGTAVRLEIFSENGANQVVISQPLAGTLALSTTSATITVPPGFSVGFARAKWGPPGP